MNIALTPLTAQTMPTLAMSDLAVNSANSKYTFLGKGFAEIVAFEVQKVKGIKLVDRSKRNELLDEMEFALSGLADTNNQIQVGRLLAVQYLVGGSITDLGDILLFSFSMVKVETGEIVWSDQLQETSGKYSYIGAFFAKSLLNYFDIQAADSTERELIAQKEKDGASLVALSEGIAALDKGDVKEAREKLEEAKKIDPNNAVASAFLSTLASASAKFKVVPERYVPYYNPAYLAGQKEDILYYSFNQGWITYGTEDTNNQQLISIDDLGFWGSGEKREGNILGYQYPVSDVFGLGIEMTTTTLMDSVVQQASPNVYAQYGNQNMDYTRGFISAGLSINPQFNIGLGFQFENYYRQYYELSWPLDEYRNQEEWAFGGVLAAVIKNTSGNLVWDVLGSYTNENLHFFDVNPGVDAFVSYHPPIYIEQTLTLALNEGSTFLALKQANDIYFDRDLYYGRLMPCVEQWFFDLFSIRFGAEGAVIFKNRVLNYGWGGTAGVTLKIWKFALDVNYTFRQRPSRSLAAITIPESVFFVTLSAKDLMTALFPQ